MPRRLCGVWDPSLITLHVVSDVVVWLSYLWIPLVMLWAYHAHRKTLRLSGPLLGLLALYVLFITACGWTHFFDALMFWNPVYRINGVVRALTAVVSLATAVSLARLLPRAVTAPVTIVLQQAAIHQQFQWLRDILDAATEGVLHLCENASDLPEPIGGEAISIGVENAAHLAQVRRMARDLTARAGFPDGRQDEATTAIHEAAMNALKHGDGKAATVRGYVQGDRIQIWIQDHGAGIPLDKLPIATLKQGKSFGDSAGLGWFFMLTFVDAAYLMTGDAGTTVVLEISRVPVPKPLPVSAGVGGDIPSVGGALAA